MKKFFPIIVIGACAAVFCFGIVKLFELRFDVGDVYAPYSSLRSDPLGTMALYESIEKLPGVTAQRDFSADNRLPENPDTTYLHLAAWPYEWEWMPQDTFYEVDRFVKRGGRLVITFFPESSDSSDWQSIWARSITNGPTASKTNSLSSNTNWLSINTNSPLGKTNRLKRKNRPLYEEFDSKTISLGDKWGVGFDVVGLKKDENDVYQPATVINRTGLPLPHILEWHSGSVMTNLDKAWQKIYTRGTNTVVAERKFGRGTVVIATDSYFLSNEAMLKARHADFLAWLVGPSKTVMFDEAHLGVMETSGLARLMRKYRLYWLIGSLILLAGLFIWKNSSSLVPPHAEERPEEYVTGKEAASGFVNLLRRNIPSGQILATCFDEWKKSAAQGGKYSTARLKEAELLFHMENSSAPGERNPVEAYRAISAALETRISKTEPRNPTP